MVHRRAEARVSILRCIVLPDRIRVPWPADTMKDFDPFTRFKPAECDPKFFFIIIRFMLHVCFTRYAAVIVVCSFDDRLEERAQREMKNIVFNRDS